MVRVLGLYHDKHAKRENFIQVVYVEAISDVIYHESGKQTTSWEVIL